MKFLFASDSFKGTLSSIRTAHLLTNAAHEVFGSEVECGFVPMADGGEGTTEAMIAALGGEKISLSVHGPLDEPLTAWYGRIGDDMAIMEMAVASGLPLVPIEKRNPLKTSSYGTGEMIADALRRGFRKIYIAIGGSVTNDGGMGCLRALGAKFFDAEKEELLGTGEDLERVAQIDLTSLNPAIKEAEIVVMCDVTNPLCGPQGATYTFSAQKGATPEMQQRLENGMQNYRRVLTALLHKDPNELPGSGAAGGLGAALMLLLRAKPCSGIETILQITQFDQRLKNTDLVITGEGRCDWQSCFGKVVQGVAEHCKRLGVRAIALVGSKGPGAESLLEHGIEQIVVTTPEGMSLEEAMSRAEENYTKAAKAFFERIKNKTE